MPCAWTKVVRQHKTGQQACPPSGRERDYKTLLQTSTRPQSSFDISHQHGTMNNARESASQQQKEDKPRSTQAAKISKTRERYRKKTRAMIPNLLQKPKLLARRSRRRVWRKHDAELSPDNQSHSLFVFEPPFTIHWTKFNNSTTDGKPLQWSIFRQRNQAIQKSIDATATLADHWLWRWRESPAAV